MTGQVGAPDHHLHVLGLSYISAFNPCDLSSVFIHGLHQFPDILMVESLVTFGIDVITTVNRFPIHCDVSILISCADFVSSSTKLCLNCSVRPIVIGDLCHGCSVDSDGNEYRFEQFKGLIPISDRPSQVMDTFKTAVMSAVTASHTHPYKDRVLIQNYVSQTIIPMLHKDLDENN